MTFLLCILERNEEPPISSLSGESNQSCPATEAHPPEIDELELKALFRTFMQTFRSNESRGNNSEEEEWDREMFGDSATQDPYYLHQLQAIFENVMNSETSNCDFPISLKHIYASSTKLLGAIIKHPADLIVFMDEVLADMVDCLYPTYGITEDVLQNRRLTLKVRDDMGHLQII